MTRASSQKYHLSPNIIQDSSTGGPGLIAGELAEEEGLISHENTPSYGAVAKPTEGSDPYEGYALPKAKFYTVLSSLLVGSFLAALDTTVVTTLLSEIASDLDAVNNISWIATAYLLSCAAFQPLFGKLSDIFGRKLLLIVCSIFFAVGCTMCVTDSLVMLIIGRFITGVGAGLTVLGTITLSDLVPLRDRGLYQGIANVFFGLGAACGGLFGGLIADAFGWKAVFSLQIPIAVLTGFALYFNLNLPEGSPGLGAHGSEFREKLKRVDYQGAFFLVSALMCVLTAASIGGREVDYSSSTFIGLVAVSVVLFAGFIYTEAYVSAEPTIPIHLLGQRTILASSLTNWFYTMGVFTFMYYIPLYYTSVMGFSPTDNGERMIPNFFTTSIGSVGAGIFMKKTGKYYSLAVVSGCLAIFGVIRIFLITPNISVVSQYLLFAPCGLAYASLLTITLLSLIAAVPMKYQACTTSIQYTFRSTGSTLGVSISTAIFQNILKNQLVKRILVLIPDDPVRAHEIIGRAMRSTSYSAHVPAEISAAIKDSYGLACKGAFGFSAVVIILGFISSLFIEEHALHSTLDRD